MHCFRCTSVEGLYCVKAYGIDNRISKSECLPTDYEVSCEVIDMKLIGDNDFGEDFGNQGCSQMQLQYNLIPYRQ